MFQLSFPAQLVNRREFVMATGFLVAGGLLSCSGDTNQVARTVSPQPDVDSISIRVRIGTVRKTGSVTVANTTISRSGGQWSTSSNEGIAKRNTTRIMFVSMKGQTVTVGRMQKKISGMVELHARDDISKRSFDVVAHIPIEQYLPGVLAGELYAHWHPATFAAQAVAARSYAIAQHMQRKESSHFDVTDGPSSQIFLGDITLDVAHRASQGTEGVVLMWGNDIFPSYYSACCGGLAATATDAISGASLHDIPPLQGHVGEDACTSLSIHKWTVHRPLRTLRQRLHACATTMNISELESLRSIRSIEPIAHNQHGRPTRLAIIDRRKNIIEIRSRDFVRAANASIASLPSPSPQIWSSHLVGERKESQIQLDGVGMGHGVGLCQYGAQELAGQGRSWEEILAWYYPSAIIQ